MSLDLTFYFEVDTGNPKNEYLEVFSFNVTHNLNKMANALGVYERLWRPEEYGYKAKDIAPFVKDAINAIEDDLWRFKQYEPDNKWGTVSSFLIFLEDVLNACIEYPNALLKGDR